MSSEVSNPATPSTEEDQEVRKKTETSETCKWKVLFSVALIAAIASVTACVVCFVKYYKVNDSKDENPSSISNSANYENAAVATDVGPCSVIGKDTLSRGGSVVDASIASMLCIGLYNAHSCGIGGGFFMTIFNSTTGKATVIDARDIAPKSAKRDMFHGEQHLAQTGSLSVGVPGEIAGYWEAHQLFGKLPWKSLFEPSINLAENGYKVSASLARGIKNVSRFTHNRAYDLWPIFENENGSLKMEGDIIRRPQLLITLRKIADEGMKAFYDGSLTSDIIQDLIDGVGRNIITKEDLRRYRPTVTEAMRVFFDDMTLFVPGPPASGPVLGLILNILDGYNFTSSDLIGDKKILTYHRIIEAFRFAYAKRSLLGDDRLNKTITMVARNMTSDWYADSLRLKINDSHTWLPDYYEPQYAGEEDLGTSHLSIVGPNGNAVAMTSTINRYFGSKIRGRRTGIIFNNIMDDFSSPHITNSYGVPPSPSNFIIPGNRPFSSMSPSIVVKMNATTKQNQVKMVAGASGGPRITSSTALVMLNSLYFGHDVAKSVEMERLHNQLFPNYTEWESGFDQKVVNGLREKGHDTETVKKAGSVVQAIVVGDDGTIHAACDSREGGYPSGF